VCGDGREYISVSAEIFKRDDPAHLAEVHWIPALAVANLNTTWKRLRARLLGLGE
jgi:hypothetical protein